MSATLQFFATAPRGLEELLAAELATLGAAAIKLQPAGVLFQGPLQTGYRVCLWSRLAGRVLLELGRGPGHDAEALYATARTIDWSLHMDRMATLAVDFTGTNAAIASPEVSKPRMSGILLAPAAARALASDTSSPQIAGTWPCQP